MKIKSAIVLIIIGSMIAILNLNGSAALSTLNINRSSVGSTTIIDDSSVLAPIGFNNTSFVLTSTYMNIGTIKNNSNQTLSLRIYIDPNITKTNKSSTTWTLTFRILNQSNTSLTTKTFSGTGVNNPGAQWTTAVSLASGVTYTVQARLSVGSTSNFQAPTSFRFEGIKTNILNIVIADSANSPRRQSYTAR
ncbi:MAG: hypothetical protein HGB31_01990 [Erysipelotrichaceae bacterium]|nr:hypothetical protein [Erysipelotrichaceae bacterium]